VWIYVLGFSNVKSHLLGDAEVWIYVLGFSNVKPHLLGDAEVWIYAAELSQLDHIGRVS
jgi:hypothetical protein